MIIEVAFGLQDYKVTKTLRPDKNYVLLHLQAAIKNGVIAGSRHFLILIILAEFTFLSHLAER